MSSPFVTQSPYVQQVQSSLQGAHDLLVKRFGQVLLLFMSGLAALYMEDVLPEMAKRVHPFAAHVFTASLVVFGLLSAASLCQFILSFLWYVALIFLFVAFIFLALLQVYEAHQRALEKNTHYSNVFKSLSDSRKSLKELFDPAAWKKRFTHQS